MTIVKSIFPILTLSILSVQAADKKKSKAPPAQAEITLQLIEASSAAGAPNDASGLVPAELRKLLTFSRYRLLDSGFVRGIEEETHRIALAGDLRGEVRFNRRQDATLEFEVEITAAGTEKGRTTLLETAATGRSGETIVLGASRMRETSKALVVLLTAKLLQ